MGAALAGAPDMEAAMDRLHGMGDLFFSEPFLEPRPLLQALRADGGAVLLIDEIDKSRRGLRGVPAGDAVGLPGVDPGARRDRRQGPPLVFLTSNNVREMGDALKRRCLHLHIAFPEAALEERDRRRPRARASR